jgi:hypothetical protein
LSITEYNATRSILSYNLSIFHMNFIPF